MNASPLLSHHLDCLSAADPVLDLACGRGRNGLYLLRRGIPVVFADRNPEALQAIRESLTQPDYLDQAESAELWQVDFEQTGEEPLGGKQFGAILVFRYLHRPLFPAIRQAVSPGGLLVYETFTRQQAQLGRPKNPDFLLEAGELARHFADWQILHRFEGLSEPVDGGRPSAISQLVARKPPIAD